MPTRLMFFVGLMTLTALLFLAGGRAEASALFVDISAGGDHTCALSDAGTVWCWGTNHSGQLGNNHHRGSVHPVQVCADEACVRPLQNVVELSAGLSHTCALLDGGTVKCWGRSWAGELGLPDTPDSFCVDYFCRRAPVTVCQEYDETARLCTQHLTGIISVSAGGLHTCALRSEGSITCWGANFIGQLGNGTETSGVNALAQGSVLNGDGTPITDAVAIDAGYVHNCALTQDSTVRCWGADFGRLSDGRDCDRTCATAGVVCEVVDPEEDGCEQPLRDVQQLAAGDSHTCALQADGDVKCWGHNHVGELGNGDPSEVEPPVLVGGLAGVVSLDASWDFTCALLVDGSVRCWGSNLAGQLGNGDGYGASVDGEFTVELELAPVPVCVRLQDDVCLEELSGVTVLGVGRLHVCVLESSSGAKCWGDDTYGQLGSEDSCFQCYRIYDVEDARVKIVPGDVNCDGATTSIDALLVLQWEAGLVTDLACLERGDLNEDGSINSIDGSLILQEVAMA